MRYFMGVLAVVAVLLTGCETTPHHDHDAQDQPPRYIFYKTKAASLAKPAWGNSPSQPRRDVKLVYDDEVRCYAVEGRERHYYDNVHDRFLRYWDNIWQTTREYSERADWERAPEEFVSEPLKKRYANVPPGNPTKSKGKGR